MQSNQENIPKGGMSMQIRDIEILYDALTKYYWKGNVLVYSSFATLPRGRFVPDSKRIILKEESYDDVVERGRQRYPLRLLVKTPEHSSLLAQRSSYPDSQTTFFISPSATDAACIVLFYVFTSEQDRKLCCPYSAGSSILLMSTELRQVLAHEDSTAIRILIQELFAYLPMHSPGFRKLDQTQLHGFVVMKESRHPSESDKTKVYWSTTGLQSTVQLTMNIGRATCFRISSACDDDPVLEESSANYLVRSASLFIPHPKETRSLDIRASQVCPKLSPPARDLQQCSPTGSLPSQLYPRAITPISYNVFVKDIVLIWSALNQYVLELGWKNSRAYLVSSVLLPYYPPQDGDQKLQVPLQNRRSLRVRAHNETGEGFPNFIFVNQNMTITSDNTPPLFQAIYFLELTETSQVVILCYVSASGRQIVLPSYQEEDTQLEVSVSENLASLLDRDDTEQATQLLVERVFPHLLPKQSLDKYLFRIQGTHDQFSLLKPIPPKHYYWKIGMDTSAVNVTDNSTEAAIFQLNETSS